MQMKKLTTLACAAAFAMLSGAASAQISGNTVKIGVLTDMSGTYSDLAGAGAVLATQMAIEDFIAEAKPAFKVEMVSADHQNKADIASNKAREWFEREGVDTATELVTTSTALAVMKIAKEMNRVALMSGPASTPITNEQCNDVTVHYTYDTYALANGTAKAVTQQGGNTWFFLTADYAFGQALEKDSSAVVTANGGKVLGSVRHPFPASDFSSFLLQAQASGAKIIGLANAGADTTNAIKQAAEFGVTPKQSLAGLLMFISDVHSLGLQATQGMYLTTGFYWDLDDQTRAWSKRFFEKQKRMPTMVQAGQYSSVLHYLRAVQATGTDEAGKVMAQMKATPIKDFFGKNGRIREDGRMVHDMYLAQVKTPAESKYPWDYYHIRQTIPAEEAFQPLAQSKCPLVKK
ncbi:MULTISPECIES: ABC transporter substrate-binding protein [Thauera]|jgi:branched-chain amino acid transport system substrate-binding protein|uniref:ABC transporter substrate-binding protein n=4 Tax=Thauera aminoaromatica TaxID=164330 RepID=C4ZNH3_THASP|nr:MULTISPECIES: ABC transporter substrate-binding protein [Thauera]MBP6544268.1 ABC transporter substrate-binding protein [Piscinibacter sp.]ACK54136.1 ABC transporter substrate-binding protein [Thauera aminoaromatica]ENO83638.1 ABC transporter substrate-binding protein [Thauera aminoaromatica S2]KIN91216.1 periplasmic binding domain protein [Thauera sp. SWB20]MBL8462622.1 ABC transporter substrate-binding protein [Thauera sp.]